MLPEKIQSQFELQFDLRVLNVNKLSGGCIHQSRKIHTDQGCFFVKFNSQQYVKHFETEINSLELLASKKVIKTPIILGTILLEEYSALVLEYIEENTKSVNWDVFGQQIAHLHQKHTIQFGLDQSNWIGELPQYNHWMDNFKDFFIIQRLEIQRKIARKNHVLPIDIDLKLDDLYQQLDDFFPNEPPSLLHGDLWSGNYLIDSNGNPVLIDPACYYGHREVELSFTRLFGGFDQRFYDSYHQTFPLQEGWERRVPIYNLYPLLVHLNLFGQTYLPQIKVILDKFLR